MNIIFIGIQGSGKGTQAKIISEKLKIPHISTGDLLRSAQGELKQEIDSYMLQGKLIPDELMLKILKETLDKADNGFILDGFPRNIEQAKALDKITRIDKAIEIVISDEEALKRLSGRRNCENCKANYNIYTAPKPKQEGVCDYCQGKLVQRKDDNEEAIKKRLEVYHKETEPILNHYKSIKINGEQDIEKVTYDIKKAILL